MNIVESEKIDSLLMEMERRGELFEAYSFAKADDSLISVGTGGFSTVYSGNGDYVIKVIGLNGQNVSIDRFNQTIRIQKALASKSENIVKIFDFKQLYISLDEQGNLNKSYDINELPKKEVVFLLQFVVMEKLHPIIIRDKLGRIKTDYIDVQEPQVIDKFACDIGQAIAVAHKSNILHRDIKLENIFWDEKNNLYKLGDFGIAKYDKEGNAETVVYTDGYGAPEIERRLVEIYNSRADLYSFGITLYLLLNDLRFPGSPGYYAVPIQYDKNFVFPAAINGSEQKNSAIRKMCSYNYEERFEGIEDAISSFTNNMVDIQTKEIHYEDLATETYIEDKEKVSNTTNIENGIDRQKKREYRKKLKEIEYSKSKFNVIASCVLSLLLLQDIVNESMTMPELVIAIVVIILMYFFELASIMSGSIIALVLWVTNRHFGFMPFISHISKGLNVLIVFVLFIALIIKARYDKSNIEDMREILNEPMDND